jgi:hypothetical protein
MTRQLSRIRQLRQSDEQGAVLVMALIFILAVGLVLLAIAQLAGTSLLNTSNLRAERTTEANAENAAMISAQLVRTTAPCAPGSNGCLLPYDGSSNPCPGSGAVPSEVVMCQLSWNASSPSTRIVQMYVCSASQAASCTSSASPKVVLYAVVTYGDVPANNPGLYDCGPPPSGHTTCGIDMTVNNWDVRPADN